MKNLPPEVKGIKGRIALALVAVMFVVYILFSGSQRREIVELEPQKKTESRGSSEMALFSTEVDNEVAIARMETDLINTQSRLGALEDRLDGLAGNMERMLVMQEKHSEAIIEFHKTMTEQQGPGRAPSVQTVAAQSGAPVITKVFSDFMEDPAGYHGEKTKFKFEKIADFDPRKVGGKSVYIPMGSFCKGVLLTGVTAPVGSGRKSFPVTIMVTDAFNGPNQTRVPLTGAMLIGRATGDAGTERAFIQIIGMSFVNSKNGSTFEHEGELGFITDTADGGMFGIKGVYVNNMRKILPLAGGAGFLKGFGEALANVETTAVVGSEGQVVQNVTGDDIRHGLYSGLSEAGAVGADYFQERLDDFLPAIYVEAGREVYFHLQKGVEVENFKVDAGNNVVWVD